MDRHLRRTKAGLAFLSEVMAVHSMILTHMQISPMDAVRFSGKEDTCDMAIYL